MTGHCHHGRKRDCIDCMEEELAGTRADERAKIVAWLGKRRDPSKTPGIAPMDSYTLACCIAAIERGEHE